MFIVYTYDGIIGSFLKRKQAFPSINNLWACELILVWNLGEGLQFFIVLANISQLFIFFVLGAVGLH